MASIALGLKKRGQKYLFEGNYSGAVECLTRVMLMEPNDYDNMLDLIYALNQNADYLTALSYCYALLPSATERLDDLYFLTAEAFGGAGGVEGCALMLERCINNQTDGHNLNDAQQYLNDIKQKVEISEYDPSDNVVSLEIAGSISDFPVLDYETINTMSELNVLYKLNYKTTVNRIEKEIESGRISITLLCFALMIAFENKDDKYLKLNADRFRHVEDYTLMELYNLAVNLSVFANDDLAYTIYRDLYSKESAEKDIAFGFAVACERIGEIEHAKRIATYVSLSEGGVGPAESYLKTIGTRSHSYIRRFEGESEKELQDAVENASFDNKKIMQMISYLVYADRETVEKFTSTVDVTDPVCELALRRVAVSTEINIITRIKAASALIKKFPKVYILTCADFEEFTEEMGEYIIKLFERGKNERTY